MTSCKAVHTLAQKQGVKGEQVRHEIVDSKYFVGIYLLKGEMELELNGPLQVGDFILMHANYTKTFILSLQKDSSWIESTINLLNL